MAGNVVSIPFNFGRQDRIAPKFAPHGVLGQVKNLRHRQMAGIGLRNGYQPLVMTTVDGTLAAVDLHEYSDRLLALGSDGGDGFPREIFEYLGFGNQAWRAQSSGQKQFITPFTNLREMIGTPLCEGGVTDFDAAAGGGYVCLAYVAAGSSASFLLVLDATTQQAIHQEALANGWGGGGITASELRVCYQGGRFYIGAKLSNNTIRILRYAPGSSQFVGTHVSSAAGTGPFSSWDLAPATNLTNGTPTGLVVAYCSASMGIKRFDHTGAQLGSTISFAASSATSVQVEADETDSSTTIFWVEGGSAKLKSYTLAGSVQAGPTTIASATSGSLCRLFAQGALATSVVVVYNDGSGNTQCKVFAQASHAAGSSIPLQQVTVQSRPVNAQCASNTTAFCLSALVSSAAPTPTNALLWVSTTTIHMASRDTLGGKPVSSRMLNLTRDATTGQLCWVALRDPGVESLGMPVVTLVDFYSSKRRQSARFGSLLYLAGAPVTNYDGRFTAEAGFAEPPTIISITPGSGGSLAASAHYSYVAHFEYTFAEGSLILSAPSLPIEGDTGAGQTSNTVVITTPHSNRVAGGSALYGADVVAVLSRTTWTISYAHATATTRDLSGLTTPLNGLTLRVLVDGGAVQTVTFTTNATSANGIRADILAQTTGITVEETSPGSETLTISTVSQDATSSLQFSYVPPLSGIAAIGLHLAVNVTITGAATGTPGSVYRRVATTSVPGGIANYGKTLSFTDTLLDATADTQEALYTQAARGPLSGTLPHDAPRACSFIIATDSRLCTAGLSAPHQFQVSKEAYLGEAFEFSDFSSFLGQVSRAIVGLAALDSIVFLCTRNEFYAVHSSGPDDLGGGSIALPSRLPTLTGLKDWRSFLEVPDGLMCQLDDDKLHLVPRGGGAPAWFGQDILNELRLYPTITGAARHRADNTAVFAANVTAETSAKLLVYDLELKSWFVDEPPLGTSSGITAITNFGRTVAYSSNGVVYLQSASGFTDGASTPITGQLTTRPIYPFGIGGYGQIFDGLLSFEFRGACDLQCRVSYDDGQSFSSLTTYTLTGTSGQQMRRKWTFPQATTTSVVIEFTVIPTGTGTEAILFNQLDLFVHPESGLPEILPAEMGSA